MRSACICVMCKWPVPILTEETTASLGAFPKLRKRPLASSCLSVPPSTWSVSTLTGWIFVKFDILVFFENLTRKLNFHCYTVHVVEVLNYYTNHCTYIKIYKILHIKTLTFWRRNYFLNFSTACI